MQPNDDFLESEKKDASKRRSKLIVPTTGRGDSSETLLVSLACGASAGIAMVVFHFPFLPVAAAGLGAFYAWDRYRFGLLREASYALTVRDLDKAISLSKRAILRFPKDVTAYLVAAAAEMTRADYKACVELSDKALMLQPDSAYALGYRSATHLRLANSKQALADAERAMQLSPNSAYARQNRAAALGSLNRFEESLVDWDNALKSQPQSSSALLGRTVSFFHMNQFDRAQADCDRLFELLSNQPSTEVTTHALNLRALLLYKANQFEKAILETQQAMVLAPESNWLAINKALYCSCLGRLDEATVLLEQVDENTDSNILVALKLMVLRTNQFETNRISKRQN